jgi:hypothetical protein
VSEASFRELARGDGARDVTQALRLPTTHAASADAVDTGLREVLRAGTGVEGAITVFESPPEAPAQPVDDGQASVQAQLLIRHHIDKGIEEPRKPRWAHAAHRKRAELPLPPRVPGASGPRRARALSATLLRPLASSPRTRLVGWRSARLDERSFRDSTAPRARAPRPSRTLSGICHPPRHRPGSPDGAAARARSLPGEKALASPAGRSTPLGYVMRVPAISANAVRR